MDTIVPIVNEAELHLYLYLEVEYVSEFLAEFSSHLSINPTEQENTEDGINYTWIWGSEAEIEITTNLSNTQCTLLLIARGNTPMDIWSVLQTLVESLAPFAIEFIEPDTTPTQRQACRIPAEEELPDNVIPITRHSGFTMNMEIEND